MHSDSPKGPYPADDRETQFALGFERICEALGIERKSRQKDLAELLDIRQSSISDAKRRGVIPGEWSIKLFRSHRLNPNWVYDGLPPAFLGDGCACLASSPDGHGSSGGNPGEAPCSCGERTCGGAWCRNVCELKRRYPEETSFLRGYTQNHLLALAVADSSMEPFIPKNSYVGLDLMDRRLHPGKPVGLDLPREGLAVRRVRVVTRDDVAMALVTADNPAFSPQHLPLDECRNRIAGRVAWIMAYL